MNKEEITESGINAVFKNYAGLTLRELLQLLNHAGHDGFQSPEDLKNYLISQSIVEVKDRGMYPSKGYDKYFRVEKYRGRTNLRYAPDLIELIG